MHQRRTGLALLSLAGLILATLGSLATPVAAAKKGSSTTTSGSTVTAQAIWTNFKPSGSGNTFGFTETETYSFDETIAHAAYALTNTTGPTYTCTGGGSNTGQPCNSSNKPANPEAPPAPRTFQISNSDQCKFWSGGTLSVVTETATTTITPASGGNWKFTWTYTLGGNPVGSDNPDDLSDGKGAWYLALVEVDNGGMATVIFTGQIAGLSAQKTSTAPGPKYSFSLVENDGISPRISGVTVRTSQLNADTSEWDQIGMYEPDSWVVDAWDEGNSIPNPAFSEFSIGAGQSLSKQMAQTGTGSILTTGDARTILNTDYFAGNQNGGATGAALAYMQLAATHVDLPEGTFTVTLSANVKGIDGNVSVANVTVTSTLRIFGLGSCA